MKEQGKNAIEQDPLADLNAAAACEFRKRVKEDASLDAGWKAAVLRACEGGLPFDVSLIEKLLEGDKNASPKNA